MDKHLVLLATGGTIASAPTERGLSPALSANDILATCPIENCSGIDVFQLDSSNIQPEEWQMLADAVRSALKDADGVIITHGTDTMAYTAAALSFMLCDLDKPVILTGSQLPLHHPLTDARQNLCEAAAAARSLNRGVYVVFNHRIIAGTRAVKLRTTSFDAFASINASLCGTIDSDGVHIHHEMKDPQLPESLYGHEIDSHVFLLKLIPGTSTKIFKQIAALGYKGLVVEAFGLGGLHYIRRNLIGALHELAESGVTTLVTTQCMYEKADFSIYEVGHDVTGNHVISARDMTSEAAVAKLMWVLGKPEERLPLLRQSICREMSV
ncbi:MAG: asparaginase [Clostridia bacterium]|nr:asparaginase [Clostridia bacterium]